MGKCGIEAKVIKDSTNGVNQVTTLQLRYHRYIHGEFMTHRVFTRNASSSRAIPVMKVLKQVWNDPAMPVHWGQNQAGMQAKAQLTGWRKSAARFAWKFAAKLACVVAYTMVKIGLHKQIANRILEPWQFIHVIVSATDWDNFMMLRRHPDAQPEIEVLADEIYYARALSVPVFRSVEMGDHAWHLPYVSDAEIDEFGIDVCKKLSTARNARVSYLTHDGANPVVEDDVKLHDRLVGSIPIHASPTEHLCYPAIGQRGGNFNGWIQYRQEVEQQEKVKR